MTETFSKQDTLPVLEVRVLDTTRKSSFRVRRLANLPIVHTLEEMKVTLELYLPDIKHVETCPVGYVLERNKKYSIGTDSELQNAYQHFKAVYQMWLDPTPIKRSAAAPRKQAGEKAAGR